MNSNFIYKSVGPRFLANLIDLAIFAIIFLGTVKLFGSTLGPPDTVLRLGFTLKVDGRDLSFGLRGLSALFYFLFTFFYFILFEWKMGATPGKWITKICVLKSNGESLSLKDSLIRNTMRLIDFLPFFYLMGAIFVWASPQKQRLGDKVADTIVVRRS